MVEVKKTVFPANIRRPAVSAVRTFPEGCGRFKPKSAEKPLKIGAHGDAPSETSSSAKVSKEVLNKSIEVPNDLENHTVENIAKEDSVEVRKESESDDVDKVVKEMIEDLKVLGNGDGVGDEEMRVNGLVEVKDKEEEDLTVLGKDDDVGDEEVRVNGLVEVKEEEEEEEEDKDPSGYKRNMCRKAELFARISNEFFAGNRKKVFAVRDFPVGCGTGAQKIAASSEAASVESKVLNDEKKDDEVRMKMVEPVIEGIREANGEARVKSPKGKSAGIGTSTAKEVEGQAKREASVKSPKPRNVDAEKKKSVLVDNISARETENEGKRDDSDEMQLKVEEVNEEATVKSSKMESSSRKKEVVVKKKLATGGPSTDEEVKKNEGEKIKVKASESSSKVRDESPRENYSSKASLKDRSADDMLMKYFSKKKSEASGVKQIEKTFRGKQSQNQLSELKGKGVIKSPKDGGSPKRKLQEEEDDGALEVCGDRLIVQALMAAENCPWRKSKKSGGTRSGYGVPRSKTKKRVQSRGNSSAIVVYQNKNEVDEEGDEGDEDRVSEEDDANEMALTVYSGPRELSVTMTPAVPHGLVGKGSSSEEAVNRNKVKMALRLFQLVRRKLLQGEESKSKGKLLEEGKSKEPGKKRVDLEAASILKDKGQWVDHGGKREGILGAVPGVEVGDEFHFRVELSIIGLHRPFQAGIDYVNKQGVVLAASIVASGGYPDDVDSSDVLIYSGSGGNAVGNKPAEDQKLERGNLALKNSIDFQTPVRVVFGSKELNKSNSPDMKGKMVSTFTYDGLYLVEKYWPETGSNHCNVFKFQLRRMPGQPEVSLKEVKKTNNSKVREGLCVKDISDGKERIPICAVNTIDNDVPMPFKYITKVMYPSGCADKPSRGCDCTDGCSDSENCACAVKNGGEIPYNYNGNIVQAKPLIYECGPSCKCPPSCYNRVSQHGIRQPLEIFKTKSRGWGVRSMYSIPSGTFICEYIGEMIDEAEAEERMNDEYLFDIGNNYDDHALWDGLPSIISGMQFSAACETVDAGGFTIDAAEYGNVGRFINHSCSPNLYAQNVLFDHDDKRMPHIMFFAVDNIPPLQELTYHYNYSLDQVRDSEGNIKKKECFCGAPECTGRLY